VRLAVELLVALSGAALLCLSWRMDHRWMELHGTPVFCFDRPGQLAAASVKRALCAALGLGLIAYVRPWLGRWAGRRTGRAVVWDLTRLVLAPALLALIVGEVVLGRQHGPPPLHFEPDSEPDERLSWRPIPGHVTDKEVGDRTVRFVIDADGVRVRSEADRIDPSLPTVLFTGESIASGMSLPYDETYAAMVAERMHVQAVNVAVQGYASDAAYLRLAEALPRFSHPLATVTLVFTTAIDRMLAPDRPHLLLQPDGSWLTEPRRDRSWPGPLHVVDLFEHASGMHSAEAARRTRDVMLATARDSRARGALPLVVVFGLAPCLPDASGAPSIDATLFEGLDLPHVHVDLPKARWNRLTDHPDVGGQRMIADAVVRELTARGVTP
jgi:hypothetical protein